MRRSRFSEEQIIGILREQEAGAATADLCRKHGISTCPYRLCHPGIMVVKAAQDGR
jgi:hypothetical protein